MDLYDVMFPKESYGEVLHALGVQLHNLQIIPFTDGQSLLADLAGNTKGFMIENERGGIDVVDESMNVIGSTQDVADVAHVMTKEFQHVGTLRENVHGGADLFTADSQLTLMSTENLFFGRDYYSSEHELVGSSSETIDEIMSFSMKDLPFNNMNEPLEFTQFSDYLTGIADFTLEDFSLFDLDILATDPGELFLSILAK